MSGCPSFLGFRQISQQSGFRNPSPCGPDGFTLKPYPEISAKVEAARQDNAISAAILAYLAENPATPRSVLYDAIPFRKADIIKALDSMIKLGGVDEVKNGNAKLLSLPDTDAEIDPGDGDGDGDDDGTDVIRINLSTFG
jgi:hypothetical protein